MLHFVFTCFYFNTLKKNKCKQLPSALIEGFSTFALNLPQYKSRCSVKASVHGPGVQTHCIIHKYKTKKVLQSRNAAITGRNPGRRGTMI